ncbi:hypothetical protein AKJ16_DCAP18821 [Drosera capensis]
MPLRRWYFSTVAPFRSRLLAVAPGSSLAAAASSAPPPLVLDSSASAASMSHNDVKFSERLFLVVPDLDGWVLARGRNFATMLAGCYNWIVLVFDTSQLIRIPSASVAKLENDMKLPGKCRCLLNVLRRIFQLPLPSAGDCEDRASNDDANSDEDLELQPLTAISSALSNSHRWSLPADSDFARLNDSKQCTIVLGALCCRVDSFNHLLS